MRPVHLLPWLTVAAASTPVRQDAAAVVREQAGGPCFAVASTAATHSGAARLESLHEWDAKAARWRREACAAAAR